MPVGVKRANTSPTNVKLIMKKKEELSFCTMRLHTSFKAESTPLSPRLRHSYVKGKAICNSPWKLIMLSDVETPTFSRQSAHRYRWGCQPYVPAALHPPGRFLALISARGCVEYRAIVRLEGLR
jgi:hypothetical protein